VDAVVSVVNLWKVTKILPTMRADIKYLGIGLFIGLSATSMLLAGILVPPTLAASLPTDTPTFIIIASTPSPRTTSTLHPPTNTYTPTPTFVQPTGTATTTNTPTLTPTVPSPTPTLSHTLMDLVQNGYLVQAGSLNVKQVIKIYEISLKYVRTNKEDSRLLGEQVNGLGYGAPSDICGPLSIAILQEVGLISPGLDPHTFWLLNPDILDDRRLLAKAFPPDQFEDKRYKVKLNKVDWNETPLYPGDFVYLYAGTGGTFEHMLVVNRVDSDGHAYAVTNHKTSNGFIISEVLLYDPDDPNVGMFPVWAARPNAKMGSTGFDGYELWRLRSPSQ
jgi:hypothetical protein